MHATLDESLDLHGCKDLVQIQRQINVNVEKPGFTTSLRSKYHISPTQSKFKSNAAKPE